MKSETISKIVKASGVSAGELVLVHFWGEDADKEIANRFVASVAALGATPVLLQQARSINREIFSSAKESCFNNQYFELFSKFDAVLDVFAYQPIVLGYQIENEQMALYRKYMSQLFYRLMECKRFTQIRVPTEANAEESNLDPQDYVQRMNKGDPEAVQRFFVRKTEQISSSWVTAYEKAKQHNDAVKMRLEQIKLDTIGEIKENFAKIWEGAE